MKVFIESIKSSDRDLNHGPPKCSSRQMRMAMNSEWRGYVGRSDPGLF
jgi:hypothetical protein